MDEAGPATLSKARPQVGAALTATLADEDAGVSNATWQWARSSDTSTNWADIASAPSASYTPVAGDLNQYLRAMVTYVDTHGTGETVEQVTANAAQAMAALPQPDQAPEKRHPEAPPPQRDPKARLGRRRSIVEYSDRELMALANWIVSDTLLRTDEELQAEMRRELGFRRRGSRIDAALGRVVAQQRRSGLS